MKRIETSTCYHCESKVENREHVPPKCLFPISKGEDWSKLITVPSCAKHNNGNSTADDYLKFILGASASRAPDKIRKSAASGAVRHAEMGSRNLYRYGLHWDNDALVIGNDFPLNIELLSTALEKIARGTYFHHHRGTKKLLSDLKVFPLFIPLDDTADPDFLATVLQLKGWSDADFNELPILGEYPEIFAFQVVESSKFIFVNMQFYGTSRVTVIGQQHGK